MQAELLFLVFASILGDLWLDIDILDHRLVGIVLRILLGLAYPLQVMIFVGIAVDLVLWRGL